MAFYINLKPIQVEWRRELPKNSYRMILVAWVKDGSSHSNLSNCHGIGLHRRGDVDSPRVGIGCQTYNTTDRWTVFGGNTHNTRFANSTNGVNGPKDGNWHQIVYTYNSTGYPCISLDGAFDAAATGTQRQWYFPVNQISLGAKRASVNGGPDEFTQSYWSKFKVAHISFGLMNTRATTGSEASFLDDVAGALYEGQDPTRVIDDLWFHWPLVNNAYPSFGADALDEPWFWVGSGNLNHEWTENPAEIGPKNQIWSVPENERPITVPVMFESAKTPNITVMPLPNLGTTSQDNQITVDDSGYMKTMPMGPSAPQINRSAAISQGLKAAVPLNIDSRYEFRDLVHNKLASRVAAYSYVLAPRRDDPQVGTFAFGHNSIGSSDRLRWSGDEYLNYYGDHYTLSIWVDGRGYLDESQKPQICYIKGPGGLGLSIQNGWGTADTWLGPYETSGNSVPSRDNGWDHVMLRGQQGTGTAELRLNGGMSISTTTDTRGWRADSGNYFQLFNGGTTRFKGALMNFAWFGRQVSDWEADALFWEPWSIYDQEAKRVFYSIPPNTTGVIPIPDATPSSAPPSRSTLVPHDINKGLLFRSLFKVGNGADIRDDVTGNTIAVTNGPADIVQDGPFGQALKLTKASSHHVSPGPNPQSDGHTIMVWHRMPDMAAGVERVHGRDQNRKLFLGWNNLDEATFGFSDTIQNGDTAANLGIGNNEWHVMAIVCDNGVGRAYINKEIITESLLYSWSSGGSDWTLGHEYSSGAHMDVEVAQLAMWNRPLSRAEVFTLVDDGLLGYERPPLYVNLISQILDEVVEDVGGAFDLDVQALSRIRTMDAPSSTAAYAVAVDALLRSRTLDSATVAAVYQVQAQALSRTRTIDSPAASGTFAVGAQSLSRTRSTDDPAVAQEVAVIVDSLLRSRALESVTINTAISLAVQALSRTRSMDVAAATSTRNLIVESLIRTRALDSVSVAALINLQVAELLRTRSLDGLTVSQVTELAVESLLRSRLLDNVVIDSGQRRLIEIDGVRVDLLEFIGKRIDEINLTGKG